MILWDNTIYSPPKFFLIVFWSIHRNYLLPFFPHILILIAFQPDLLNRSQICRKSLTTHRMTKLRTYLVLLLRDTTVKLNLFFWLLNQLLFSPKSSFDIIQLQILNLPPMFKLPLLQIILKTILKLKMPKIIRLNFNKVWAHRKSEELFEPPYGANKFELSDIQILKKDLHGYHAAYFSGANLHLSLETMQFKWTAVSCHISESGFYF